MDAFRSVPSVEKLLSDPRVRELEQAYSHDVVMGVTRACLDDVRAAIKSGKPAPDFGAIVADIGSRTQAMFRPSLRPLVNATGIIVHTNLGRAPLSKEAIEAINVAARGYSNLEFDLGTGRRGSRHSHIESLVCKVTGAEAAMVVNNNASAVLLALSALAKRKEVIVSRGQAVEIGGGFRIPDVMRQSGAKLVEVGTTNRTYAVDYERAITPSTAALLRVHSSNFKMLGFIHQASIEEITEVGRRNDLIVLDDLGSGCLLDATQFGLDAEPMVQESIRLGVGLAMFSGDKLLGGPQAGIVAGKKELVDKLKKHPLARAVRIDKLSLAGLSATLTHYLKGEALVKVPVWRMISTPQEQIERRARNWAEALGDIAAVVPGESMVGGGSLPGSTLPTMLLSLPEKGGKANLAMKMVEALRHNDPPVIARVEKDRLLLDPRTVFPEEDGVALKALQKALEGLS